MIGERRISPGEINRYISDMQREIDELERQLQALREAAGTGGGYRTGGGYGAGTGTSTGGGYGTGTGGRRKPGRPPGSGTGTGRRRGRPPGSGRKAAAGGEGAAAPAGRRRRRTAITAEQLASRQLQGRYLGLIRQIPANRRAQYQKIAKDQGREAAINAMKSAVGR